MGEGTTHGDVLRRSTTASRATLNRPALNATDEALHGAPLPAPPRGG